MPESLRDLLDRLDFEHGAMKVTGTSAGPLLNARAIAAEMRRILLGEYDPRRDTSEFQKLPRPGTDDDTKPGE